jgi:hypothetical protein
VTASIDDKAGDKQLVVVDDYLALSFEQRYDVMSQRFPAWLKDEPIFFPADHPTYAWACLVNGCNAMLRDSYPGLLCMLHFREYKRAKLLNGHRGLPSRRKASRRTWDRMGAEAQACLQSLREQPRSGELGLLSQPLDNSDLQ